MPADPGVALAWPTLGSEGGLRESGRREAVRRRREALWLGRRRQERNGVRQRAPAGVNVRSRGGLPRGPGLRATWVRGLEPRPASTTASAHLLASTSTVGLMGSVRCPLPGCALCATGSSQRRGRGGAGGGCPRIGRFRRSITAGACNVCSCGRRGGRRTAAGLGGDGLETRAGRREMRGDLGRVWGDLDELCAVPDCLTARVAGPRPCAPRAQACSPQESLHHATV